MKAVIESGGKQLTVEEGDSIEVELLEGEPGSVVQFPKVLLLTDGEKTIIGKPAIDNCVVKGTLESVVKGPKLEFLTYKKRSLSQTRRRGHRQKYSKVKITEISHKS